MPAALSSGEAALADGDINADEADELKAEASDNLGVAYRLSKTEKVANATLPGYKAAGCGSGLDRGSGL